MKWFKYISGMLVAGALCCSCNNWLDVKPVDKMTEDGLYSSEKGFQWELNGVYLSMVSNALWGENLSCGALEVMGQHYFVNASENSYYGLAQYRYTEENAKKRFDAIWSGIYNLIANCNIFIEKLQENREVVTPSRYELYLGEAYGLRALFHLEMLRIFGPVCSEANMEEISIPYYDSYSPTPLPLLKVSEVVEKINKDLDYAIKLLEKDPIRTKGIVKGEGFWDYRNARLNYYAAWILKGRLYLHAGKKEEARHIATKLLAGEDPDTGAGNHFPDIFLPVVREDLDKDRVYLSELVFYAQNLKRDDRVYKALFTADLETTKILAASDEFISDLYSVEEQNDFRSMQWTTSASHAGFRLYMKYAPVSLPANDKEPDRYKIHPLVRLSELYLMAAETSPEDTECLKWLEELRLMRGYQIGNTVGAVPGDLLNKEYSREYFGEGQYFFYLKRNNVSMVQSQGGNKIQMETYYQVPLPDSEKNYRYE